MVKAVHQLFEEIHYSEQINKFALLDVSLVKYEGRRKLMRF